MTKLVQVLKLVLIIVLGISLSYILVSCKGETSITDPGMNSQSSITVDILPELPIAQKTSNDYDQETMFSTFWNTEIHRRFSAAYGDKYTESLKESMIEYVAIKMKNIGENETDFIKCVSSLNSFTCKKCLPCMVESAKYDGKDAFIFVFNWGMAEGDIGHIAYFAVEKSTQKILYQASCK